jgi:hypothetical protein
MRWASGIWEKIIPQLSRIRKKGSKKAPDPVFGYAHCLASYYYYLN